jgi:hypothetical protein
VQSLFTHDWLTLDLVDNPGFYFPIISVAEAFVVGCKIPAKPLFLGAAVFGALALFWLNGSWLVLWLS